MLARQEGVPLTHRLSISPYRGREVAQVVHRPCRCPAQCNRTRYYPNLSGIGRALAAQSTHNVAALSNVDSDDEGDREESQPNFRKRTDLRDSAAGSGVARAGIEPATHGFSIRCVSKNSKGNSASTEKRVQIRTNEEGLEQLLRLLNSMDTNQVRQWLAQGEALVQQPATD